VGKSSAQQYPSLVGGTGHPSSYFFLPVPFEKPRIKKPMAFTPLLSRLRSGDFGVYYRVLSEEVVLLPLLIREIAKGF
jgi:hypothetical protein